MLCTCARAGMSWSPPRARVHTCALKLDTQPHVLTAGPFVFGELTLLPPTLRSTRAPDRSLARLQLLLLLESPLDVQPEPRGSTLHRSAALAHPCPCPCPCPCPPSLCPAMLASQLVEFCRPPSARVVVYGYACARVYVCTGVCEYVCTCARVHVCTCVRVYGCV